MLFAARERHQELGLERHGQAWFSAAGLHGTPFENPQA
jgi:hypothetical protein